MSATYLPIFLRIDRRPCLVVGGGEVAERKVRWLLDAGALVTVWSPYTSPEIQRLAAQHPDRLQIRHAAYAAGSLHDYVLAVAATDEPEINQAVAVDAAEAQIPVNVVDDPDACTFIVPATARRDALVLAVATGGAAPALSNRIRRELDDAYPAWYALYVRLLGHARKWAKQHLPDREQRQAFLASISSAAFAKTVAGEDEQTMWRQMLGQGETYLAKEA